VTDTTRAAERGRTDALLALERAREAYAAAGQELPTDPTVLQVVAYYAPPREQYSEPELQAFERAWWEVIFGDAIARLLKQTASHLGDTLREAADALRTAEATGHVCDESCTVTTVVTECAKHGPLGTANSVREAREMMLDHLRSHHPRGGRSMIAHLEDEQERWR